LRSLHKHELHPHIVCNANHIHRTEQVAAGFDDKLAVFITNKFGNIWMFYALIAWMLIWMVLATAGIWVFNGDRYPFSFLLFLSNLIQLWALPVLAFGQQVLSRKAEIQADQQFKDVENSYRDIEQIMRHLSSQDEELLRQSEMLENHYQELCKQTEMLTTLLTPSVTIRRKVRKQEVGKE